MYEDFSTFWKIIKCYDSEICPNYLDFHGKQRNLEDFDDTVIFWKPEKQYLHRQRQEGTQGTWRCPKWEKMLEKNDVISKSFLVATTIPKIVKNSIFLLNFYQKFSKNISKFPNNVFRPNTRKQAWFVNFLNMLI